MQEVNLSYGEIDHESALKVADALANKKDVKKIELNGQSLKIYVLSLSQSVAVYLCNLLSLPVYSSM